MLMRLLLTFSFVLTILFAACIGIIRAQPYDDSQLRAVLAPPDGCPMPCWQGIRPGITPLGEARAILQTNPWVTEVELSGDVNVGIQYASLTWKWSGTQPFPAEPRSGGTIGVVRNVVRSVTLQTRLELGSVWLSVAHPEEGAFLYSAYEGGVPPLMVYRLTYTHKDVGLITFVSCRHFWELTGVTLNYERDNLAVLAGNNVAAAREASCEP
jgi:hypothetical protein